MKSTTKRTQFAAAFLLAVATTAAVYSAFAPARAHAQPGALLPARINAVGPVSLNGGESALIGLLLPAVQRVERAAQLDIFDSAGKLIVEIPVAMGDGSVRTAFYHISFADGSVRVLDAAGKLLATAPRSDGILSAVLLPAVQRNGLHIGAASSSLQIFDANGARSQYIGFCDGSV